MIRHLILVCALGSLTACITPADGNSDSGENDAVVTGSDTAQPHVVMEGTSIAGRTAAGEKVHCRSGMASGSRDRKNTCLTDAQRREQQEYAKEILKGTNKATPY